MTEAIKTNSPKIILVHNHPSGDSKPSKSDLEITKRLINATSIIGIEMLDHIIIGDGTFESILERIEDKNEII